jgi:hypothetical protein
MAIYTVHLPPGAERDTRALRDAVFVREGFAPLAYVFGPFWLLAHGLWLSALVTGVAYGVLMVLLAAVKVPSIAMLGVHLLLALLFGLEARTLLRRSLRRRGLQDVAVVRARSRDDAEQRFFDAVIGKAPAREPGRFAGMPPVTRPAASRSPEVIGLFPESGPAR